VTRCLSIRFRPDRVSRPVKLVDFKRMKAVTQKSVLKNRRRHIATHGHDVFGSRNFLQDRRRQFVRPISIYRVRIELEEKRETDVAARTIGDCWILRRNGAKFARGRHGGAVFSVAMTRKEKRRRPVELEKKREKSG